QTNDVFNAINNQGDIGTGMNLTADGGGSGAAAVTGLGYLYSGAFLVAVDPIPGGQAAAEEARIRDALADLNTTLEPFGVVLTEATPDLAATADIHIHFADTTAVGGVAEGVLGITALGGNITLVTGWNWFTGTAGVGADQYDFQT